MQHMCIISYELYIPDAWLRHNIPKYEQIFCSYDVFYAFRCLKAAFGGVKWGAGRHHAAKEQWKCSFTVFHPSTMEQPISFSAIRPEMGLSAAATIHLLARSNSVITELRLEGVEYRQTPVGI